MIGLIAVVMVIKKDSGDRTGSSGDRTDSSGGGTVKDSGYRTLVIVMGKHNGDGTNSCCDGNGERQG